MVTDQNNLLASKYQWDHALGLGRLSRLIDQNRPKFELGEPRVTGTNASAANDVRVGQDFALSRTSELLELLFVLARQFTKLVLKLRELGEFDVGIVHSDLLVQGEEANWRLHVLARLGGDTNYLQTSTVYTFTELINSNVGWCTDQHLTVADLGEMVNDGRRCDGFTSSWWSLN